MTATGHESDRTGRATALSAVSPLFTPAASESLRLGAHNLDRAFRVKPIRHADRGAELVDQRQSDPEVLLIDQGFAYRSCFVADGRRAILDILTVGDIVGLDHVVLAGPLDEFVACSRLSYRALSSSELRRLMATDPALALRVYALLAEARWRASRLAISIGRLDAQARICLLLLDIYDRLRRRELINQPTYNLPLTQEEIADHLGLTVVHVNRTLRRLREERVVFVNRQAVMIRDMERMRGLTQGLIQLPERSGPDASTVAHTVRDRSPAAASLSAGGSAPPVDPHPAHPAHPDTPRIDPC